MNRLYKIIPVSLGIIALLYFGWRYFSNTPNPLDLIKGSGLNFGGTTQINGSGGNSVDKTLYKDGIDSQSYQDVVTTESTTTKQTKLSGVSYGSGTIFNVDETQTKIFTKKEGDTFTGLDEDEKKDYRNYPTIELGEGSGGFGLGRGTRSNCSIYMNEIVKNVDKIKSLPNKEQIIYIRGILNHITKFGGGSETEKQEVISLILKDIKAGKSLNIKLYCEMIDKFEESLIYKQCMIAMGQILDKSIKDRNQILQILESEITGFISLAKPQKDFILDEIEIEFKKPNFSKERICSLIQEMIYENYQNAQCFMAMDKILALGNKMSETSIISTLHQYMPPFKILSQKEQEKVAQGILQNYNKNGTINAKDECFKIDSMIAEKIESSISYAQCLRIMEDISKTYGGKPKEQIPQSEILSKLDKISGFNVVASNVQLEIALKVLDAIGDKSIQELAIRKELCRIITAEILTAINNSALFQQCVKILNELVKTNQNKNKQIVLQKLSEINGFDLIEEEIKTSIVNDIVKLQAGDDKLDTQISNICIVLTSAIIDAFKQTADYKKCISIIDDKIIAGKVTTQEQIREIIEKEFVKTGAREELIKNIWSSVSKNDNYADLQLKKEAYCLAFVIKQNEELAGKAEYQKCMALIKDDIFGKNKNKDLDYIVSSLQKIFPIVDIKIIREQAQNIVSMPTYNSIMAHNICYSLVKETIDVSETLMCVKNLYAIYTSNGTIEQKKAEFGKYLQNNFKGLKQEKVQEKTSIFNAILSSSNLQSEAMTNDLISICVKEKEADKDETAGDNGGGGGDSGSTEDKFNIIDDNLSFPDPEQYSLCRRIITSVENKKMAKRFQNVRFCNQYESSDMQTCIARGDSKSNQQQKDVSDSFLQDYFIPSKYYSVDSKSSNSQDEDKIRSIANDPQFNGDYFLPGRYNKDVETDMSQTFNYTLSSKVPPFSKYTNNTDIPLESYDKLADDYTIINVLRSRFVNTKDTNEISNTTLFKNIYSASIKFCNTEKTDTKRESIFISSMNDAFSSTVVSNKADQKINNKDQILESEKQKIIINLQNSLKSGTCQDTDRRLSGAILDELVKYSAIQNEPSLNLNNSLNSHTIDAFISRLFIDKDLILNPKINENLKIEYIRQLGNCTRLDKDISHWRKVSGEMKDKIQGKKDPAYSQVKYNVENFRELVAETDMYKIVQNAFEGNETRNNILKNCKCEFSELKINCENICILNSFEYYKNLSGDNKSVLNRKVNELSSCTEDVETCKKDAYHQLTIYFEEGVANKSVDNIKSELGKISGCENKSGKVDDKADFASLSEINQTFIISNTFKLMKNFQRSAEQIRFNIIKEIWEAESRGEVTENTCLRIIDKQWGGYDSEFYNDSMKSQFDELISIVEGIINNAGVSKFENLTQPPSIKCKCVANKMIKILSQEGKALQISNISQCVNTDSANVGILNLLSMQAEKYNLSYSSNPDNQNKTSSCVILFSSISNISKDSGEISKFKENKEQNEVTRKQICVQQLRDIYNMLKVFRDQYFNQEDVDFLNSYTKETSCDSISDA